YALIELADRRPTIAGLHSENWRVRRAALIALDQMPASQLAPEVVVAALGSAERELKETALWIAGRHPEWGGALVGDLRGRMDRAEGRNELTGLLARLAKSPAVQELLAERLRD